MVLVAREIGPEGKCWISDESGQKVPKQRHHRPLLRHQPHQRQRQPHKKPQMENRANDKVSDEHLWTISHQQKPCKIAMRTNNQMKMERNRPKKKTNKAIHPIHAAQPMCHHIFHFHCHCHRHCHCHCHIFNSYLVNNAHAHLIDKKS